MLTVTDLAPKEDVSFSHVMLLGADGEMLQVIGLTSSSSSYSSSSSSLSPTSVEELVGWVDPVPGVPFCVQLTGRDNTGNKFERVSTEMVHPTRVQIQVALMLNTPCFLSNGGQKSLYIGAWQDGWQDFRLEIFQQYSCMAKLDKA